MKFLIPIALLALSSSFVSADLEEQALWMLECCNMTMSTGLPAAGVPPHLPYVKLTDRSLKLPLGLGDLYVSLSGATWAGLPFYDPPKVSGVSDGERIIYNYSLLWPEFVLKGKFDWNITTAFFGELAGQHAEFSITFSYVRWWGTWNMTLPKKSGEDWTMPHLDEFTLESRVEDTETELKGLGLINGAIQESLNFGAKHLFNNFPKRAAEFLRTVRFNGVWMNPENPEKLLAVLANCGLKP